ncbi:cyclopropane-fatty-acyl-phospholipid synthase [Marinobacterium sp. MBR-111]|jgi:cyclopropane-fatty-acyl-phospholipid synthase|uniref:Cyclopropane-fatty-acyl-phospholipid synthase n=1 Tax=Marinobacterium iners DSM 11526 TaxID=1122198 RepID=A0A1H4CIL4_9GAMM|nr:cyclopropane-fatty-acyl-phospholipid synthase family protein [Marinobacterium iners]SEA60194.1 cyclopropane-fatty-acyl-phospholipid synthase [Marinobacterium iners DSM 11526]
MKHSPTPSLSTQDSLSRTGWLNRWCLQTLLDHLPRIEFGTLDLQLPSGQLLQFGQAREGEPRAEIRLHHYRALRRLLRGGAIGWAEGYMEGDWDSPDLESLLRWALGNESAMQNLIRGNPLLRMFNRLRHLRRANTRKGSRRNIAYHYDLGNDFYRLWLDRSMTYSAALYEDVDAQGQEALYRAQLAKYRRIAEMLELQPGQRVLEIGCGWGGFAELAAQEYGVEVHGITLSTEQLIYARERIEKAGLNEQCRFTLTDYRDVDETYDHIVSIEMFEAVGEEHWPVYFNQLKRCLRPGGRAVLQIISIEDQRFERYRNSAEFIQTYIFPGGMLPGPGRLRAEIAAGGLQLQHEHTFALGYARTLREWHHSFIEQWPRVQAQGFDERFRRMWVYYLAYCEAGFRHGSIDVGLYQLSH